MRSKLLEKQVVHEGSRCRLEVHRLENPETGARQIKPVMVHPGTVLVIGVTSDNKVLLIRTYRYAVDEVVIELPGGGLEKDETPMNCAGRELLEETGYLAGKITPLASFYSSPAFITEGVSVFVARDLERQEQRLQEGEEIEVLPVPLGEAIGMAAAGEIRDARTIAALLMYDARYGSK